MTVTSTTTVFPSWSRVNGCNVYAERFRVIKAGRGYRVFDQRRGSYVFTNTTGEPRYRGWFRTIGVAKGFVERQFNQLSGDTPRLSAREPIHG